ncbi:MFS transporter [Sphingomonas montanisoli]|uniref:MFS transporter n=1 Tax=Sphingomonas montanisoli TaxID=2606412 RepID=UPI0015E19A76|nr:MFS transporter [Sphingomonas montanisoli]
MTHAPVNAAGKTAIALGGVLPGVALGTISVMLPGIADAFGNGENGLFIKMVATATGLGMMIGAPIGGWLSDRWGRPPILATATVIFGLVGCGMAFAAALWQLILGRFIVGLMVGTISTGYIALIGDHFSGSAQSKWLSINGALATFLVVALNPITGMLAELGWREAFLVYAMAFPCLILLLIGVPRRILSAAPQSVAPRGRVPFAALLLGVAAGTLATGTSLYWPFRLREVGLESAQDIALYALPNTLLIGAAAFSYGIVRRRLSIHGVFMLCGFMSALGLIIMAIASTPAQVALGLLLEGVGVGLLTPNLSLYTIELSPPDRRAAMIGLVKGVYFGSPFLTQFALEWINHRAGTPASLLAIAVMAATLGLVMLAAMLKTRSLKEIATS